MDQVIDITTSTPSVALNTLLNDLCNKCGQIKTDICSALSKTGFSDVLVTDIAGKGKSSVL